MKMNLVTSISEWCKRPGMYLVDPRDNTNSTHILFAMITGYETCLRAQGLPSELQPLVKWVVARDPSIAGCSIWFGEVMLNRLEGDHAKTIAAIKKLCDDYLAQNP